MRRARLALVVVFIALVAVTATSGSLEGRLIPRLDLVDQDGWIAGDEATLLTYTLENTSAENLQVLRWQTPLRGIEHNMFDVTLDGKSVAYTGKLVKRAAPQPSDYVEIKAGQSLSVVFDPSSSYDMARAGEYTITYRTSLTDMKAVSGKRSVVIVASEETKSNVVDFFYDGLPPASSGTTRGVNCSAKPCHPKCPPNPDLCGGDPGGDPTIEFVSCNSQQQGKAITAIDNATSLSASSYADLADGSSSLYGTWFGAYKSNRYNTVTNHFQSISDAFANETITINCTDADLGVYAYVYPGNAYEIFVAYYFFHAPNLGRDSAAGTLVHEMSHFNVVAGTSDYVYGESAALQLAQQNPRRAINNADNHEYFAEDH